METVQTSKIPIERVGAPGKAWLALQGSVLQYHKQTWVSSATMYIPIEWIRVQHGGQRDLRRLWHGLLAAMIAILFALPASLAFRVPLRETWEFLLLGTLAAFAAIMALFAFYSTSRFFFRRPTTTLAIEGTPHAFTLRFWRLPGQKAAVEALLARIETLQGQFQQSGLHPVRMNHLWHHPRPYRIALAQGLSISFILYIVVLALELLRLAGYPAFWPRAYYALLAAPPLASIVVVAFRQAWNTWREPAEFSQALRHYRRGELAEAVPLLEIYLGAAPQHITARLLLIRVLNEQCAFDAALRHCERLAVDHPVAATRLQATVWDLKRLHARMEEPAIGD